MHVESEKEANGATHIEKGVADSVLSETSSDEVYSAREQAQIIHRIDRRLVTTCGFMYCISLMDRTNLPAAAIAGYTIPKVLLCR